MSFKRLNNRGQIAIWIILGIALVASMVLFFTIERGVNLNIGNDKNFEPQRFIDSCVRDSVEEQSDKMMAAGGFLDRNSSVFYEDREIVYLCYNSGNYKPCINQHPMLLNEMKDELVRNTESEIEQCFIRLREEIEKRNGNVQLEDMKLIPEFGYNRIFLNIERKVVIEKDGQSESFSDFKIEIISPMYNLAKIAMEITRQEAKSCYFEYVGFNLLHPEIDIRKTTLSEGSKIYLIEDKRSGKSMDIAIRGCTIPAGI